ncbi:MAG: endonuclease [Bacteroidales bacterium]|nr:endonuclease [Bacteroidales bacterium]
MKNILTLVIFLFAINYTFAQIPDGYYDNAEGLTGETLKTALYNIIKGHVEFPYVSENTDVWDILKVTDRDPDNSDNVILLYTGWSVNAAQEYNNGNGWTKEHVWSKSHGDFGTTMGPGTDVHHLRPADVSVNSAKNNRWFDNCDVPYYDDGVFTGCYKSNTEWVWEPRDEVKGDIARMIFYMATRYEGENGEPDLELINYLPADDNTPDPVYAMLSTLYEWNTEDPVSEWEERRNNIIHTNYQHNRNPYIDHPEWVTAIWGPVLGVNENNEFTVVYPNPSNGFITIKSNATNLAKIKVYNELGQIILSLENVSFPIELDLTEQNSGIVFVQIIQGYDVKTEKIILVK